MTVVNEDQVRLGAAGREYDAPFKSKQILDQRGLTSRAGIRKPSSTYQDRIIYRYEDPTRRRPPQGITENSQRENSAGDKLISED
jgi:hypothetical protein